MTDAPGVFERRMVRRIRLVVTVHLVTAISLAVLLVGGLAFLVTSRQQDAAAQRYLRHAVQADKPVVAPACLWLFTLRGSDLEGPAQAPPGFPLRATMRAVANDGRAVDETVRRNGTVYRVHTVRQGDAVSQAVFDLAYQRKEDRQLLLALMAAGMAGLVGAATLGAVLSRRAITPLVDALDRQRRFVADASHELRAPLARLHTRTQLILHRAPDLPESVSTELERMVKGTRELDEVIDDVLRSASLHAEPHPRELVDLGEVAADLVTAEAGRLEERGLTVRVWLGAPALVVPGVASSLRRIVSALVDNAIGHSRAGGRIVVSVDRVDAGRNVELVVADDGVGLDPASAGRLFERFQRGASGSGRRYGIGLALVREVVERHGGTISATGAPGYGTRFVVRLPAARPCRASGMARRGRRVRGRRWPGAPPGQA